MVTSRFVAGCVLLGSFVLGAQDVWKERVAKAKLSLLEAAAKGRQIAGAGVVFHVELEPDGASLVYSIDIASGTTSRNVVLDAATGKVVEDQQESEDHSPEVSAANVDLSQAVAAALKAAPGQAIEAELVLQEQKPLWKVRVFSGDKVQSLGVDGGTGVLVAPKPAAAEKPYTEAFVVDKSELKASGKNPFFVLEPGFQLVLEGKDGEDSVQLVITVLDKTRTIDGVVTRALEERETENGELKEISINFFAISARTNDVYYFGEEVDMYEGGKVVSHEGAWMSGEKGARFGLLMPGSPLLGARYYQELAPDVAMDRAEVVSLAHSMDTPAGRFENCLRTVESSALEQGSEYKTYAPGIGLIQDEDLRLVKHGKP